MLARLIGLNLERCEGMACTVRLTEYVILQQVIDMLNLRN